MRQVPLVIPALATALLITDLGTAFLLMLQFREDRSRSLLLLACAYLFTAWMAPLHVLAFPGAIVAGQTLIGGPQTSAVIFLSWHLGFPALVLAAVLAEAKGSGPGVKPGRVTGSIVIAAALVAAAAVATVLVGTFGHDRLPILVSGTGFPLLNLAINGFSIALCLGAVAAVWLSVLGRKVLYLWAGLALLTFAGADALALVGGGRYSLGWYASRASLLVAGSLLFLFLLAQIAGLHRSMVETLQRELFHLSRLNSMGQTASMLAHEINQPLTATVTYLRGIERLLQKNDALFRQVTETLGKAAAQVERAIEIVRRLRGYVEKREPAHAAVDVSAVIEDALALMGGARHGVTVVQRVGRDVPLVLIDKVQIQQVLVNLIRNAFEAMDGLDRREVTIGAACALRDFVSVSVADTGRGLAPDMADALFKPFVTSKKDGMGVGLSICRTIVHAHGGTIWAEENPSGGTVFCFTLPIAVAAKVA
jgi:signal transduction histidine kinase